MTDSPYPSTPPDVAGDVAPAGPRPTPGRIVNYVLSEADISRMRVPDAVGSTVVPAIVIYDQSDHFGMTAFTSPGGTLAVWASVEGTEPGQWSWPPREPEAAAA